MRPIDADALRKNAQHAKDISKWDGELLVVGLGHILNAPTISPRPDWTPCAEGLPKESGRYIVTVKRTVLGKETEFTSERDFYVYLSAGYKWESTGIVDENIIAWMPKFKPAPYRADDTTGKVMED